jgi:chaperonin GroES
MEVVSFNKHTTNKPKIKPVGNKMLVLPDPVKETSIRGIIIPMSANSQLEEATVILVSADVDIFIKEGERILYPRASGVEQEYDGIKYKFLNGPTIRDAGDIWAII